MALGDFDSNQSSFEFGQSLLADKDRRDKKARKRQKKMKNISYLLGTVAVADMFLANKARKKAELFQENMTAEMMTELHRIKQANTFHDKQLSPLYSFNSAIDFEDPEQWKEGGTIWNALNTQAGQKIRAGKGTAQTVSGGWTQESYDKVAGELASKNLKTLKNKYDLYKGSIGDTEKQLTTRTNTLINDGVRDIMSAKNTSSIRKLLSKFDILNDINPDLELVEMGGQAVYVSKDKAEARKTKRDQIAKQRKDYNEKIEIKGESRSDKDILNSLVMKAPTGSTSVKVTTTLEDYKITGETIARTFYGDEWKSRDLFSVGEERYIGYWDVDGNIKSLSEIEDADGNTRFYVTTEDGKTVSIFDLFSRDIGKGGMSDIQSDAFVNAVFSEARILLDAKQSQINLGTISPQGTYPEAQLDQEEIYSVIDNVLDDYVTIDADNKVKVDTFDAVFMRKNENIYAEDIRNMDAFMNTDSFLNQTREQKRKSMEEMYNKAIKQGIPEELLNPLFLFR